MVFKRPQVVLWLGGGANLTKDRWTAYPANPNIAHVEHDQGVRKTKTTNANE